MRVIHTTDTATLKLHFVLRQSASLVCENILDLTQIFCDVQSPALHGLVRLLVIELDVLGDEVDLSEFDQLHGHIQREGYHRLVKERKITLH